MTDDLTVSDALTIQGHLSGATRIAEGGDIQVQGDVTGRVVVEAGGSLQILGAGTSEITNRGLLILGGTFDEGWLEDVAGGEGTVVVWPGTLVTRHVGLPYIVNTDGACSVVDGSAEVNVSINADPAQGFLVFQDGAFTPIPTLPGR